MPINSGGRKLGHGLLILVLALVLFRLVSLGLYPLMDTTEARYAEIARKMVELNDWITPWFDYGVPFWGKPPLSFWMTAMSFKLFGINEVAARLPHFVGGMLVMWIVWNWALRRSRTEAYYSVTLLGGGILFYISSGTVMTDMWLLLGTLLSMRGFWIAVNNRNEAGSYQGWLFFIGLAMGLLSKGPIALVLTGLPIFFWLVFTKNFSRVWASLPWVRGSLLTLAMTVPWYVLAEIKTPGFLNYFLIGEHFQRFINPGWQGDLYGSAHYQPKGTIWLFMLVSWFPWSFLFPLMLVYLWVKRKLVRFPAENNDWYLYLLLWGFTPAIFFTVAGNILWTYVLPGVPGITLLLAGWFANQKSINPVTKQRFLLAGLTVTLSTLFVLVYLIQVTGIGEEHSAKSLISLYNSQNTDNEKLFYYGNHPYSASFYGEGKVEQVLDEDKLKRIIKANSVFLAIEEKARTKLSDDLLSNSKIIGTQGKYQLCRVFSN